MSEIKVSVIIYVRNTIDYIERCIRSVMSQTLQEIEILIIDGGSTDGTLDIIERMRQIDSRIRIFHAPASVGAQFNVGLKEARGQYIGVCEADDYILPQMYEREFQIAYDNQLDVIRAGYYQNFDIYDKEYRFKLRACYQDKLTDKIIISNNDTFFLEQGVNGFWNGLYRRGFLLDNHIWMNETGGAAYQDISFSFLTQMYAKRIWFVSEAFYCYRIDNPNASVNCLHGIDLHIKEYEELKKRLKDTNQWEKYKNIFFSWELISYRWFIGELPENLKMINIKKIYHYLKSERDGERYEEKNVLQTVRGVAEALLIGEQEFVENIVSGTENGKDFLRYVENSLRYERKVIIFGVGHIGGILKEFFDLCNKEVLLMDNNKSLQKKGLSGEIVYRPEELTACFPQGRYIIANISHAMEMKSQLMKFGIPSENILICDDEEFFLRRIFAKARQYIEK
ncbi:glycosyltransferase [Lachnospiraceae bacterium 62-26]